MGTESRWNYTFCTSYSSRTVAALLLVTAVVDPLMMSNYNPVHPLQMQFAVVAHLLWPVDAAVVLLLFTTVSEAICSNCSLHVHAHIPYAPTLPPPSSKVGDSCSKPQQQQQQQNFFSCIHGS